MEARESFQYRALIRKSLTLQRRQTKTNACVFIMPVVLITVLSIGTIMYDLNVKASTYINDAQVTELNYNWPCDNTTCGAWNRIYYTNPTSTSSILNSAGVLQMNASHDGFIGVIPQSIYLTDLSNPSNISHVPFFDLYQSEKAIDQALYQRILKSDQNDETDYWTAEGAVIFRSLNTDISQGDPTLDYTLQVPSGFSQPIQPPPNGFNNAQRALYYLSILHGAFLSSIMNDNQWSNATWTIIPSFETFKVEQYNEPIPVMAFESMFILPMALGFGLPVYVYALVLEKSERLLQMMRMMGLSVYKYWAVTYLFNFLLYLIVLAVVLIIGVATGLDVFWQTNPIVYLLLFLFWGTSQVSFSFLVASAFSSPRAAMITSYLIVLFAYGISADFNAFFMTNPNEQSPLYYLLYLPIPPMTFVRGVYLIVMAITDPTSHPLGLDDLYLSSPIMVIYYYLIGQSVILMLIAMYLGMVFPGPHGIPKSPLYPIHWLMDSIRSTSCMKSDESSDVETGLLSHSNDADELLEKEDTDCAEERRRALDFNTSYMLRIVNMRQVYNEGSTSEKIALQKLCLALPDGECFGLLGPNGAGKTTLASVLCGLTRPTSGYATISRYHIPNDIDQVYQFLGFCPQHDILWEDLTTEEHLLFYCRLKGIAVADEQSHVAELLAKVHLTDAADKRVSELSGGMKRRLSLAISLVGSPRFVLLDEPTTGLDPVSRRLIWDIITAEKSGRCTIVTTHNMEEADVLCTRIGILSRGALQCIGSQLHLKNRFGSGYKLSITCFDAAVANDRVLSLFPNARQVNSLPGLLNYELRHEDLDLPRLFSGMIGKEQYCISEWAINQTSLEEVFLRIVAQDEQNAEQQTS